MNITLLKWSRFLHKWIGIYIAVFAVLWCGEFFILPLLYHKNTTLGFSEGPVAGISLQQLQQLLNDRSSELYGDLEDIELRHQIGSGQYTLVYRNNFTILTIDAADGRLLSRKIDYQALFSRKAGLGWINERLGDILKAPFQIFVVILSITGLYILFSPRMKKKKNLQGVFGLTPGQQFIYRGTSSVQDMAKTASIGLLPGVRVTLLYFPSHGPLVFSARNTRIAVAQSVAKSFLITPVEI